MATSNDIKNGSIVVDNGLWQVIEFQHVKPGKGGAFVRTKQKNVLTGKVVEKTYNAGAKVEFTEVDRQDMDYIYADGDGFVFMNNKTYDQVSIPTSVVGDDAKWLQEGMKVTVAFNEGSALFIELPASVELEIIYTEPGLQGDRSNAGTKPATVKTTEEFEVQVPLFITQGERVVIDTRTGEFKNRAN